MGDYWLSTAASLASYQFSRTLLFTYVPTHKMKFSLRQWSDWYWNCGRWHCKHKHM